MTAATTRLANPILMLGLAPAPSAAQGEPAFAAHQETTRNAVRLGLDERAFATARTVNVLSEEMIGIYATPAQMAEAETLIQATLAGSGHPRIIVTFGQVARQALATVLGCEIEVSELTRHGTMRIYAFAHPSSANKSLHRFTTSKGLEQNRFRALAAMAMADMFPPESIAA